MQQRAWVISYLSPVSEHCLPFFSPSTEYPSISPTMVGRYISDELKEMALSMSLQGLRDLEVHELMGISVQSLKRLRSTYRKTGGDVSRKPIATGVTS